MNWKNKIPKEVHQILEILKANGFQAYFVGGCIRDLYLNKIPNDFDITTSANPKEIKRIFGHTIDIGLKHGTVMVIVNKEKVEITTFKNNENLFKVDNGILEDISKRDFTMNTLLYDGDKIIDYYKGVEDLENKVLKAVENPRERFLEDPLRILRAIRFSCIYDLHIEKSTFEEMRNLSYTIKDTAVERIREELNKIIMSSNARQGLEQIIDIGLDSYFLLSFIKQKDIWKNKIEKLPKKLELRWSILLFSDTKKAKLFLSYYKFDQNTIRKVMLILSWANKEIKEETLFLKESLKELGKEVFEEVLLFQKIIKEKEMCIIEEKIKTIILSKECYELKSLKVNGEDLKKLGIQEGKKIGEVLNLCLKKVMIEPSFNEKEKIIQWIKKEEII